MDEPGAALDLMAKNEILRLIKRILQGKEKSVIITSHEMSENHVLPFFIWNP